jgi:hypothetical protein
MNNDNRDAMLILSIISLLTFATLCSSFIFACVRESQITERNKFDRGYSQVPVYSINGIHGSTVWVKSDSIKAFYPNATPVAPPR